MESIILRPFAKINIGLDILYKRQDGFHELRTLFYPIFRLNDELEVKIDSAVEPNNCIISVEGEFAPQEDVSENLCVKTYKLMCRDFSLPGMTMRLKKNIPFGAGLGGGSSDAANTIIAINELCELKLDIKEQEKYGEKIGSDVNFFLHRKPMIASGRGEILQEYEYDLSRYYIVILKPEFGISTAMAYRKIVPSIPSQSIKEILRLPIKEWKSKLKNDFFEVLNGEYKMLGEMVNGLYEAGAIYASLSGSGSAVYGIFSGEPNVEYFDRWGKIFKYVGRIGD